MPHHHTALHGQLLAGLLALCSTSALAAKAHTHGSAELNVSIDKNTLVIAIDSPLDNLLGFEHPPGNAQDEQRVRAMAARLRKAETLFAPSAAAACALTEVSLESAAIPAQLLGESDRAGQRSEQHDGHADLDGSFTFRCQHPEALQQIEVKLFAAFPRLQTLHTQLVTAKGQHAATLSAQSPKLTW